MQQCYKAFCIPNSYFFFSPIILAPLTLVIPWVQGSLSWANFQPKCILRHLVSSLGVQPTPCCFWENILHNHSYYLKHLGMRFHFLKSFIKLIMLSDSCLTCLDMYTLSSKAFCICIHSPKCNASHLWQNKDLEVVSTFFQWHVAHMQNYLVASNIRNYALLVDCFLWFKHLEFYH